MIKKLRTKSQQLCHEKWLAMELHGLTYMTHKGCPMCTSIEMLMPCVYAYDKVHGLEFSMENKENK